MMKPKAIDFEMSAIVAAVTAQDRKLAVDLATSALAGGLELPLVLLLAAEGLEENGRGPEALGLLKKAASLAPDSAEVWRRYGGLLAAQARLDEAVQAFDEALDIDPDVYLTLIGAGAASFTLGDLKTAKNHYRRAAVLAHDQAEPLAALAAIAVRGGDSGEARGLATRALELRPDSMSAHMAIGRADVLDGAPAIARARMDQLLDRPGLNDDSRVGILDLRAEALDALDRPAEAFADYKTRNTILQHINAPRVERELSERRPDQARRLAAYFAAAPAPPWRTPAGGAGKGLGAAFGHAFLIGFPRSGTTLLEKALAGHPDIVTLEEIDHLADSAGRFLVDDAALNRLATLTPAEADACRLTYWSAVRESLGRDIASRVLVDKLPLHTPALPVIAKLFPEARIVFALRDPRDVVLSCFRRRFRVNAAMYEFLTLDGAARYYDQVMALAEIYRGKLSLAIHDVRHEAVVSDFDREVRKVLAFIGAEWDPAVKGFAERARANPRTPSDPQVARGLNADGIGQWRRYERQLAEVSEILTPWVSRFGYQATGSAADTSGPLVSRSAAPERWETP